MLWRAGRSRLTKALAEEMDRRHAACVKLTAVFIPAPEWGFAAMVEEVPGAISQGETMEEARANLADALRMVLECNRELARETEAPAAVRESLELSGL